MEKINFNELTDKELQEIKTNVLQEIEDRKDKERLNYINNFIKAFNDAVNAGITISYEGIWFDHVTGYTKGSIELSSTGYEEDESYY